MQVDRRASLLSLEARRHRPDIQGLRALAVLLVIGNHAGLAGLAGGYVGVDVFFVVSGYVITQLLLRSPDRGIGRGLIDFYSRRVRRIVPAATVTLVVTLLAARLLLGHRMDPSLPTDARWASLFSANLRFIRSGTNYFVPGLHPSLITQFWSLGVEEQFYLVFPLILLVVSRAVPSHLRSGALALVLGAAVGVSAPVSALTSAGSSATTAYYSPLTRFWELGLGCLLAVSTTGRSIRTRRSERLAGLVGVTLLLIALVVSNSRTVYPGVAAWLPCGGTAVLIWAGRRGSPTAVTRLLGWRPLVHIGDLSYSLYLWHYVWLKLPEQLAHPLTSGGWRVVELVGTFVTAELSYRYFEDPIRRSPRLAADPVSVVLLLAVCVTAVWLTASVVG